MGQKTIAEALEAAADDIDLNGWWNGGSVGLDSDANCAGIAIADQSGFNSPAMQFFAEFLRLSPDWGSYSSPVYVWNDAQPDGATVIAKLREAAAAAREQGL